MTEPEGRQMLDETSKPWFVGKGVKLWRRSDFVPRGLPFQAFAVDYRDGMIEVIGLDPTEKPANEFIEVKPKAGTRAIVPMSMLGGIATVDEDELREWQAAADWLIFEPRSS